MSGTVTPWHDALPESWSIAPLGDLFSIQQGKALNQKARDGKSPRPFLRTSNVLWGELRLSSIDTMDFTPEEQTKLTLQPGDLFVCEGGDIGRTAIWSDEIDGCYYQNHLHRCRARTSEVDPHFYMFWMWFAVKLRNLYAGHGNLTTIANLSKSRLAAFEVAVPPLLEQRAIAHVLRTVQRAKEATEQVISAAQELKKSLMRHLFSNGSKSTTGEVPSSVETEYGAIPPHWRTSLLSDCAVIQSGATKGRRIGGDEALEVPYLRVANVQDGFLDLREIKTITIKAGELDRFALRPGDILLTEGGDFDKLGRGHIWRGQIDPCVHQNHVFAVRPDSDRALPEFTSYLMQSPYAKRYFLKIAHRTTNLASINKAKLGRFPMLLPPIEEQEEVIRALTKVDQKIAAEEARREALAILFDSLLHGLMSGRRRVSDLEVPA